MERKPRAGVEPSEEGHAKRVPERPAEHPNRLERGPPQQQRSCRSLRPTIPREEGRGEGGGAEYGDPEMLVFRYSSESIRHLWIKHPLFAALSSVLRG